MLQRVSCVAALLLISASASAQQPCTTDARHVVDEMYRHMLERTPDPCVHSCKWCSFRYLTRAARGEGVHNRTVTRDLFLHAV